VKTTLGWVVLVATVILIAASPARANFTFARVDHAMTDPANPARAQSPYAVALADMDGVHGDDIVVANFGNTSSSSYNGSIAVLLNNGDGSFAAPVLYDAGRAGILGLLVHDFGSAPDGKQDVLVASYPDFLRFDGDGAGHLSGPTTIANDFPHQAVGNGPGQQLALGRVNGITKVIYGGNAGGPAAEAVCLLSTALPSSTFECGNPTGPGYPAHDTFTYPLTVVDFGSSPGEPGANDELIGMATVSAPTLRIYGRNPDPAHPYQSWIDVDRQLTADKGTVTYLTGADLEPDGDTDIVAARAGSTGLSIHGGFDIHRWGNGGDYPTGGIPPGAAPTFVSSTSLPARSETST
jgi:hypothetical protein